jgi:hypothetical protein
LLGIRITFDIVAKLPAFDFDYTTHNKSQSTALHCSATLPPTQMHTLEELLMKRIKQPKQKFVCILLSLPTCAHHARINICNMQSASTAIALTRHRNSNRIRTKTFEVWHHFGCQYCWWQRWCAIDMRIFSILFQSAQQPTCQYTQ